MLEFGNSVFVIDVDAFDKAITLKPNKDGTVPVDIERKTFLDGAGNITGVEVIEKTYGKAKELDAVKYDLLKMFVEYLMDYDEVADTSLGFERALAKAPLYFKIVFNTLLNEGILKELEVQE